MNAGEGRPERRQSPRVDLLAELQGRIVTLDEEVRVTQLSLGGMTIETGVPLSPRSSHEFRLSYGTRTAVLKGQVVHSRVKVDGDTVTYVTGIAFRDPSPQDLSVAREIIDATRAGESAD